MQAKKKESAWYYGGIASIGAVCITHPLDTIKVQLQTQQKVRFGFVGMVGNIYKTSGVLAFYNGLSAAVLRQGTYSTTRFAVYDMGKKLVSNSPKNKKPDADMPFIQKVVLAGGSGIIGSFIGSPADLVNVRMQNDCKLPVEQRRNYKHCFDALYRIFRNEGVSGLFKGTMMACSRGMLVTIGHLAFYDELKYQLILSTYFEDNLITHFTSSIGAAVTATMITMPIDVLKTRLMSSKPGQYSGIFECAKDIMKNGPSGFFKGFTPAFVRMGPQTVLLFVFLEQLKKHF